MVSACSSRWSGRATNRRCSPARCEAYPFSSHRIVTWPVGWRRLVSAARVHILDDGFQHLQLARTIDVLLVSPGDLAERVLPSGRLREGLDAARGADALLVSGTEEDAARVSSALNVSTAFRVETRFGPLRPLGEGEAPAPAGARVLAVSGIARPERFFRALREQGWNVVAELAFPDHHWYTTKDLASINNAAQEVHARIVVTTEKDAVRVGEQAWWAALPMEVAIEPEDQFTSWLRGRLPSPLRGFGEAGPPSPLRRYGEASR